MKKFILFIAAAAMLCGCAESKKFKKADGTEFVAKPYGWVDKENRIDGVVYDLSGGNIVWSCVLGETVVVPLVLTGLYLWEPVDYIEPKVEPKE